MRVAAFATVKLNSERVPHKNIQPIGGRPLCCHILNTALQVDGIDDVYIYCSDENVRQYIPSGVKFLQREKWLDGNEIRARDTYTAFLNDVQADIYIALCTTSPFTKRETLKNALDHVLSGEYDSAFSAKRIQTFAWYQGKPMNYDIENVPRTQDMDPIFVETSAFFIFSRQLWEKHGRRIGFRPFIQEVGEIESVDIDTMEDLEFAQMISGHVEYI